MHAYVARRFVFRALFAHLHGGGISVGTHTLLSSRAVSYICEVGGGGGFGCAVTTVAIAPGASAWLGSLTVALTRLLDGDFCAAGAANGVVRVWRRSEASMGVAPAAGSVSPAV